MEKYLDYILSASRRLQFQLVEGLYNYVYKIIHNYKCK